MLDRILAWTVFVAAALAFVLVHLGVRELDRTTLARTHALGELHALRHEAVLAATSPESLRAPVVSYLNGQLARTRTSPLGEGLHLWLVNGVGGPRVVVKETSAPVAAPR